MSLLGERWIFRLLPELWIFFGHFEDLWYLLPELWIFCPTAVRDRIPWLYCPNFRARAAVRDETFLVLVLIVSSSEEGNVS